MKHEYAIAVKPTDNDMDWDFLGTIDHKDACQHFGLACLEHSCHEGYIVELVQMNPKAMADEEHFITVVSVSIKDVDAQYDNDASPCDGELVEALVEVTRSLNPTPGLHKLGPAAQQAARSRAKAFYPFT